MSTCVKLILNENDFKVDSGSIIFSNKFVPKL